MSKLLTQDDKLVKLKTMCKSFTKAQVEHLDSIGNINARYTCAMRYMRELNEAKKGERIKALEYYERYGEILEGLDCIDNKLWTDEKKIRAFSDKLDGYCDKCVKLVEENNRKHLERLKAQLAQRQKVFEAERAKYDKEIKELEMKLGDRQYPKVVNAEVSLIP
jgi:hypothetical protein